MRPPPPLDDETIDNMSAFLESHGGCMDFGKFTREFKGFKKAQLEGVFAIVPDGASSRMQITLEGVEPRPEERPAAVERAPKAPLQLEPLVSASGENFVGTIISYDPGKMYGFINCDEVPEGDVYFKKSDLEEPLQEKNRGALVGSEVLCDIALTPDGKPRASRIVLVNPPMEDEEEETVRDEAPAPAPRSERGERGEKRAAPQGPPLGESKVQEMVDFLNENGGAMDLGKFSKHFKGVKKGQLEPHFVLVSQDENSSGRFQITLDGVDPLPWPDNDRQRGARPREAEETMDAPAFIQPSEHLWLIGCVKKWDAKKGYGFLEADGVDNVFLHRSDLPPELQSQQASLIGVEFCFELEGDDAGKTRARSARALIRRDAAGDWILRHAAA